MTNLSESNQNNALLVENGKLKMQLEILELKIQNLTQEKEKNIFKDFIKIFMELE